MFTDMFTGMTVYRHDCLQACKQTVYKLFTDVYRLTVYRLFTGMTVYRHDCLQAC